jgi:hypothetical protein
MRTPRQASQIQSMVNQTVTENAEYFNYLVSIITNDGRCTHEIECKVAMAKEESNKKKILFTRKLDLNLGYKLVKYYIWNKALYFSEIWTLRKVEQKYLERFEI